MTGILWKQTTREITEKRTNHFSSFSIECAFMISWNWDFTSSNRLEATTHQPPVCWPAWLVSGTSWPLLSTRLEKQMFWGALLGASSVGRARGEQQAPAFRRAQVLEFRLPRVSLSTTAFWLRKSFSLSFSLPSLQHWAALAGLLGGVSDTECSAQSLACLKYSHYQWELFRR